MGNVIILNAKIKARANKLINIEKDIEEAKKRAAETEAAVDSAETDEDIDALDEQMEKIQKEKELLTSVGKFKNADLENRYLTYVARKDKQGKPPRDRIEWKVVHDYLLYDSPMARGNAFNDKAVTAGWYKYNEVHLENGKRLDSYDPVKGEIVSRKATDLDMIDVKTFERYLKELRDKYPAGAKIRSDKYPTIDGQHLQGKQILEIPASNQSFERIDEYKEIARHYGIEIRFREE